MMRRIIKTFFYFALFIILIGCKTKNPIEIAAGKVFAGINLQAVTDDLILPSEIEGVAITWVSGDPDVVTSEGEVFRQEEDVTVDLYAYFSYENLSDNKIYLDRGRSIALGHGEDRICEKATLRKRLRLCVRFGFAGRSKRRRNFLGQLETRRSRQYRQIYRCRGGRGRSYAYLS